MKIIGLKSTSTAVPSAAAPSARRHSRLSIEALAVLKAAYNDKTRLGSAEKEVVAKNAGISVKKVDTWFCQQRFKNKKAASVETEEESQEDE